MPGPAPSQNPFDRKKGKDQIRIEGKTRGVHASLLYSASALCRSMSRALSGDYPAVARTFPGRCRNRFQSLRIRHGIPLLRTAANHKRLFEVARGRLHSQLVGSFFVRYERPEIFTRRPGRFDLGTDLPAIGLKTEKETRALLAEETRSSRTFILSSAGSPTTPSPSGRITCTASSSDPS